MVEVHSSSHLPSLSTTLSPRFLLSSLFSHHLFHPSSTPAFLIHLLILFSPPASELILPPCCSVSVVPSLPPRPHTHSHRLPLCRSRYTFLYLSLHLWLNLSLSLCLFQWRHSPTGKVIPGCQAPLSPPIRSSHYLRVIFQIWPLIGFLLRLSQ